VNVAQLRPPADDPRAQLARLIRELRALMPRLTSAANGCEGTEAEAMGAEARLHAARTHLSQALNDYFDLTERLEGRG